MKLKWQIRNQIRIPSSEIRSKSEVRTRNPSPGNSRAILPRSGWGVRPPSLAHGPTQPDCMANQPWSNGDFPQNLFLPPDHQVLTRVLTIVSTLSGAAQP
jgi:hypothetical protein